MTDKINSVDEKNISWDEALEHESWISPTINIYESDDKFTLIANMPGVKKESLKIKLEDLHLILMGRIDYENLVNLKFVLKESEISNFYRKFKLSEDINTDKIDAEFVNGQLIVLLPKEEKIN